MPTALLDIGNGENAITNSGNEHSATERPASGGGDDGHYFGVEPRAASRPLSVDVNFGDLQLKFVTDRGVFSHGKLDAGTRLLLLEGPPLTDSDLRVLDLGCGWGPIACAAARRAPHAQVTAVDVNARALRLTRDNAAAAGAGNVTACHPDRVDPGLRFDRILSNPPIRIGKAALRGMLAVWLDRLEASGRAHLVAHRHLGSDSLARWLAARGHGVTRLLSRAGYRILEITPRLEVEAAPGPAAAAASGG